MTGWCRAQISQATTAATDADRVQSHRYARCFLPEPPLLLLLLLQSCDIFCRTLGAAASITDIMADRMKSLQVSNARRHYTTRIMVASWIFITLSNFLKFCHQTCQRYLAKLKTLMVKYLSAYPKRILKCSQFRMLKVRPTSN